ncbi:MAG TPA: type II toxin-antitoxin system HicA family toxin [Dehalococcoidia bacterium]|nr:type II toxin-antitoxin system HicA family toxin [Dehalococcoidia bacterium]
MKPLSQREIIRRFRALGFEGPRQEGRHPYMTRGRLKIHIAGRHGSDITVALQMKFLRQAGISKEEWENA